MTAAVGSRRRRCRPLLPAVGLALLLLVVGGCTDDGAEEPAAPDPPPAEEAPGPPAGRNVAVVLPAATEVEAAVLDGLAGRMEELADDLPGEVGELRVRRPDGPPFVADLLELAAARQAQLACVLGPGTAALADTVARRHGGTTVCSLPAEPSPSDGEVDTAASALRVEAPVFELGVLVGTAARTAALARIPEPEERTDEPDGDGDAPDGDGDAPDGDGDAPDGDGDAPDGDGDAPDGDAADDDDAAEEPEEPEKPVVGLVLGGDALDPDAFRAGLLAGLGEVEAIEVATVDAEPVDALAAVLAAGAEVVVFDGAQGAAAALAAVPPSIGVLLPVDLAPAEDDPGEGPSLVLAYRLRWEELVAEVVARVVAGEPAPGRAWAGAGLLELRPGSEVPGLEAVVAQTLAELFPGADGDAATAPPAGASRDVGP